MSVSYLGALLNLVLHLTPTCARGEGFINDVGKSFGYLDYILCLLKGDKIDGILNIDRGKFG